jgi:hypothetical protein
MMGEGAAPSGSSERMSPTKLRVESTVLRRIDDVRAATHHGDRPRSERTAMRAGVYTAHKT